MKGKDIFCPFRIDNNLRSLVEARAGFSFGGVFMGALGSDEATKFCKWRIGRETGPVVDNQAHNSDQGNRRVDFYRCLFTDKPAPDCIVAQYYAGTIDWETYIYERARLGFPMYNTPGK